MHLKAVSHCLRHAASINSALMTAQAIAAAAHQIGLGGIAQRRTLASKSAPVSMMRELGRSTASYCQACRHCQPP